MFAWLKSNWVRLLVFSGTWLLMAIFGWLVFCHRDDWAIRPASVGDDPWIFFMENFLLGAALVIGLVIALLVGCGTMLWGGPVVMEKTKDVLHDQKIRREKSHMERTFPEATVRPSPRRL
jgi:hypothetical protein